MVAKQLERFAANDYKSDKYGLKDLPNHEFGIICAVNRTRKV